MRTQAEAAKKAKDKAEAVSKTAHADALASLGPSVVGTLNQAFTLPDGSTLPAGAVIGVFHTNPLVNMNWVDSMNRNGRITFKPGTPGGEFIGDHLQALEAQVSTLEARNAELSKAQADGGGSGDASSGGAS